MRVLVQRCSKASCVVANEVLSKIDNGLTLLVSFTDTDNKEVVLKMVNKIINLRIFPDDAGVMNLSIKDINGEILSISQFTLYADTTKGNRPSYMKALSSDKALILYQFFNSKLNEVIPTKTGAFGKNMEISLVNMGPTTIMLEG